MEKMSAPVRLQPYQHQVGGHIGLLTYDDMTVCKPLRLREHQFYQNLPKDLQEFAPIYKGAIEVNFKEDRDGYVTFLGYPTDHHGTKRVRAELETRRDSCGEGGGSDTDTDSQDSLSSALPETSDEEAFRLRMRSSGSIEINHTETEEQEGTSDTTTWSALCHKRQLEKMIQDSAKAKHKTKKFILLENVTSQFQCPCILDIKVGTRQHGDDQPQDKIQRKMLRCANTTSCTLGLRLGGMQVYQVPSGKFLTRDKYWGRRIKGDDFMEALNNFFYNGICYRTDVLEPMIERLTAFKEMVERQHTFRFYSSSLLVMYDGKSTGETMSETNSVPCENASSVLPSTSQRMVDVRMIDFEHSTFQGFCEGATVHPGPDQGYLFGLNNLIKALQDIRRKNTAS